ncbi:MAG: PRC-barrel domain-containing protein [Steroidobacteraceae bacterium]
MTSMGRAAGRIIGGHKKQGSGGELMEASTLTRAPVINALGESLGRVRDIVIDVAGGRIAYVVLEFDGFPDLRDKLYAVPWCALTLDADNGCLILNMDKRRLKDAPAFDQEHWRNMGKSEWTVQVDSFYSSEPFWRYHA